MASSRSAKEICRDDPGGISCKIAKDRERRRAAEGTAPEPETPSPPVKTEPPPSAVKDRQKYLDEQIRKAEGK